MKTVCTGVVVRPILMSENKYVFLCLQVLDDSSGLVGFGADIDWREVETHKYTGSIL